MRRFKFGAVFALALSCTFSASTASALNPYIIPPQPLIGSVDWVDQDSILGWACYSGVSSTFVPVNLWAYNTSSFQWTFLGTEFADKGRDDVGGAGVCGTTPESYYHGFELTIFPEQLIATQGTYQIYAYVGTHQLPGSGTVSFATAGFPTSGIWRTDYNDPNQRLVSMVSCIWPFKGANPKVPASGQWSPANADLERLMLNAGATIYVSAPNVPSTPNYCLRNEAGNPTSWYWGQSNSATNASSWPMANYWVVSANNELAYSKTQSGPPSQSEPINPSTKDKMYTVSMDQSVFTLAVNNNMKAGYGAGDFPFLSLGAQMGRGTAGPIGWIQPAGQDTHLEFQVRQDLQSPGQYHDIAVYVEMMWGGYKRWIGISLVQPTQHRYHWNWNALESFWFPGGEFNLIGTQTLVEKCSLSANAQLPVLLPGAVQVGEQMQPDWRQVSIPLRGVLECLENVRLENKRAENLGTLGWEVARPRDLPLAITGVHLSVEQADYQNGAFMQTSFTKPTLVNH